MDISNLSVFFGARRFGRAAQLWMFFCRQMREASL